MTIGKGAPRIEVRPCCRPARSASANDAVASAQHEDEPDKPSDRNEEDQGARQVGVSLCGVHVLVAGVGSNHQGCDQTSQQRAEHYGRAQQPAHKPHAARRRARTTATTAALMVSAHKGRMYQLRCGVWLDCARALLPMAVLKLLCDFIRPPWGSVRLKNNEDYFNTNT